MTSDLICTERKRQVIFVGAEDNLVEGLNLLREVPSAILKSVCVFNLYK